MKRLLIKISLWLTVVGHFIVCVVLTTSPFWAAILLPLYFYVPICSVAVWRVFSRSKCILTQLEDHLRIKLGMKPINKFIRHYYKLFRKFSYRRTLDNWRKLFKKVLTFTVTHANIYIRSKENLN